jgi:acyl-CoA hydrolase
LAIIVLPAKDASGTRSPIVARLPADHPFTLAGHLVDVVATEYGLADLRGCDPEERADRLCSIAAPYFREKSKRSLLMLRLPVAPKP